MNKEQKLKSKQSVKDSKLWRAGWNNGYQEARKEFERLIDSIETQYPDGVDRFADDFKKQLKNQLRAGKCH